MSQATSSTFRSFGHVFAAVFLAGLFGLGAGTLMARFTPENKFSWAGLAIAPLWLLIEILFEGVIASIGAYTKAVRIASTLSVVVGFYIAWFIVRY